MEYAIEYDASMMKNIRKIILLITIFAVSILSALAHDFQLQPRLPNGLTINPAGRLFDVGNMPLSAVTAPDGNIVLLLSGFREQGVQVVDPKAGKILQTVPQASAFLGLIFSTDGKTLYASGANEDAVYEYSYDGGSLQLIRPLSLKSAEETKKGTRYPAGLALSTDNQFLYVAENLSDSLAIVDLKSGVVVDRKPAGLYPYAVVIDADGRIYVSAWGGDIITRFKVDGGKILNSSTLNVAHHPSALLLDSKTSRLFVTSGTTDSISIINTKTFQIVNTLKDAIPGTKQGSTPNALALSADGRRLYVAEADSNAVAVFEKDRLIGRIPVGWYPTALIQTPEHLYVVNGKGRGTRANPKATHGAAYINTPTDYTLGQLNGTICELPATISKNELQKYSQKVAELNNWNLKTAPKKYPPFKHVLYFIKENRTYDQVFGDMPQGDGDPSLLFFNKTSSPNHRAMAERFGLFDRFFVNAEVSSQGHPWSTAAYVTDYVEKTVHSNYSDRRDNARPEGEEADPALGYFWDLATRNKISLRIFGEYAELSKDKKTYHSTKPGGKEYTSPTYPSYDLTIQDQARADAWITEFNGFVKTGVMPALQIFHLPNDHTAGAKAGMPTPAAYFADNDLALGRILEALSNSPFWKDTVVFVVEDDSQSGPDHVDSHRSVLLVMSAYNQSGVQHRFVNTTDVIATIEGILGIGSLSQFDHFGRPLYEIFSDKPDLTPYKAIVPEQSLKELNPENKNAQNSLKLRLEKEDLSDDDLFNRILWAAIKGDQVPYPGDSRISLLQLQQEE
jgi:DNA-binding beta-propeller fold protein YncE